MQTVVCRSVHTRDQPGPKVPRSGTTWALNSFFHSRVGTTVQATHDLTGFGPLHGLSGSSELQPNLKGSPIVSLPVFPLYFPAELAPSQWFVCGCLSGGLGEFGGLAVITDITGLAP
ncbi:hypothetical protein BaRGS_00001864 [Batillaria attramentaria]|uniref:Uncharacterized protein n=1 Tax=Batillaria attramentaria TaxID=370345 RepID=A0ABD0M692_9CAEN